MEDKNIILCKLLGIKPSKHKCNDCANGKCLGQISNDYCQDECLIYPNLSKPSNFVKLLEIMNSIGYDLRVDKLLNYRQAIIGKAIYLASTNQSHFKEEKATFKQQAHSREWEY